MTNIEALESDVKRLRDELRVAQERLTEAKIAICGVKVGDIVVKKGARYLVTEVDVGWSVERPWVKGAKQLKDGSWGAVDHNLYSDWVKELQEAQP